MEKYLRKLDFVFVLLIVFSIFYAVMQSRPEELVIVPYSGDSNDIIRNLYEDGFLNNKLSYYILLTLNTFDPIEPGGYSIKKGMGALAIHAELKNPDYKYIAIQEGLRKEEIAALFAEELAWTDDKEKEFLNELPLCTFTGGEGYFFPGNYLVHKDESVHIIREEMNKRALQAIDDAIGTSDDEENIINVEQVLTIASLIQREAASSADMRLISGIIWNRLFSQTPLQIDATLQYVKGDEEVWWPGVSADDKYLDSPYNTYQEDGLPPGPIANPGKAAIAAAINPSDTNCFFYLHDKNRNIHCSTTYEGHKQNVSYYLQ